MRQPLRSLLCCVLSAALLGVEGRNPSVPGLSAEASDSTLFTQQAIVESLISQPRSQPSLGSLFLRSRWFSGWGAKPAHISPLAPKKDLAEWRTVQRRYQHFLKKYQLDPTKRMILRQPQGTQPVIRILMCYPLHFTVPWSINAHMKPQQERVDRVKAVDQWEHLVETLLAQGAEIELIDQERSLADMVFTANGGVVDGRLFVPPHFANVERQPETPLFEHYFRSQGYAIADVAAGSLWEGEGDTLVHNDTRHGITRFGGYGSPARGFRSNVHAQNAVADRLGQHFIGLELVDPRFYHLDTCFFPLGDGKSALYYPGAFTAESQKLIQQWVSNPIPISEEDAVQFACNGVTLGKTVIMNRASATLKQQLQDSGFVVVETPTTEFLKSGGSVKCLILLLSGPLHFPSALLTDQAAVAPSRDRSKPTRGNSPISLARVLSDA